MKILSVELGEIRVPLRTPFKTSLRTVDAVNFTPCKFDDADGCKTESARVDDINANFTSWTDINKMTTLARVDVPYLACALNSKLSRIAYIEIV